MVNTWIENVSRVFLRILFDINLLIIIYTCLHGIRMIPRRHINVTLQNPDVKRVTRWYINVGWLSAGQDLFIDRRRCVQVRGGAEVEDNSIKRDLLFAKFCLRWLIASSFTSVCVYRYIFLNHISIVSLSALCKHSEAHPTVF